MFYVLEVSKITTGYAFELKKIKYVPSNLGLVTGPFSRSEAAEKIIRIQSCGWTVKWEVAPEIPLQAK